MFSIEEPKSENCYDIHCQKTYFVLYLRKKTVSCMAPFSMLENYLNNLNILVLRILNLFYRVIEADFSNFSDLDSNRYWDPGFKYIYIKHRKIFWEILKKVTWNWVKKNYRVQSDLEKSVKKWYKAFLFMGSTLRTENLPFPIPTAPPAPLHPHPTPHSQPPPSTSPPTLLGALIEGAAATAPWFTGSP